jgi:hypothetical protein
MPETKSSDVFKGLLFIASFLGSAYWVLGYLIHPSWVRVIILLGVYVAFAVWSSPTEGKS